MAKANSRLAGHGLRGEGWPFIGASMAPYRTGPGMAKCECGAMSDVLPNTARRQAWHRAHKDEILFGQPNLIRGGVVVDTTHGAG